MNGLVRARNAKQSSNTKRVEKQDYVINPLEELKQQDLMNLDTALKNLVNII